MVFVCNQEQEESRAVNPPRLQILRIDGVGIIGDVIMHGILRHL